MVASFIHLQWANPELGANKELNSILQKSILSTNYVPGTGLGARDTKLGDTLTPRRNSCSNRGIVILSLHHTMLYDVGGGVGGEGYGVLQELHLWALNQPDSIREVYLEEVIPSGVWRMN